MGVDYWRELIEFIKKMARAGTISASDIDLIYATDSVEEAIAHIREKAILPFAAVMNSADTMRPREMGLVTRKP